MKPKNPIQLNLFPTELGPTCPDCGRPTKFMWMEKDGDQWRAQYWCKNCNVDLFLCRGKDMLERSRNTPGVYDIWSG